MDPVLGSGFAFAMCGLAGFFSGRLATHRAAGLEALGTLCAAVGALRLGNLPLTGMSTVLTLLLAWTWWKGGGGDDTRRGGRRLRRMFTPSRRTAPAPS
ncbi:hypothetical protein [Streptomyces muensis]|uniref:Uncharacterized protein n=1 Tax=Streptomyces muensis TaxID=1077944 RepID=A0A9X1PTZ1_STRM4|nr:hypothetical protein [Streptomyces muensis]MCF1592475.1 hypothetical protein [Streptomyces muensis]